MKYNYNNDELYNATIKALSDINVKIEDIAEIALGLQKKYVENLTIEECVEHVKSVLRKREVMHAILTGLAIDRLVEDKKFPEPIQSIIANDEGLYGIDEILILSIVNVYGSIGLTNFGFLDKQKHGIINELDQRKHSTGQVATFADDIVAAVAAAAAARIAHGRI